MSLPVVQSVTTSQFNTGSTTLAVAMPATVDAGDLLVMIVATDGSDDLTTPTGWERMRSSASGVITRITIYAKVANGTEDGGTVNLTIAAAQDGAAHVYRITNHAGMPTSEGTATQSANTLVNPPSAAPNWGTRDVLFIIAIAADTDTGVSSWSTNYTDNQTVTASGAGDANGATCITATRGVTDHSGTEDPANTTLTDSVGSIVSTLALRGPVLADDLGFARFYNQTGSKITTPDEAGLDITGDLDIRVLFLVDETGGQGVTRHQNLITKGNPGAATGSFVLRQTAGGTNFQLSWRESGGTIRSASANASSIARGKYIWARVVLDVDNGAGQYAVSFYTSTEAPTTDPDTITWSLVNTVTGSTGTSSINSSTEPVWLGNRSDNPDERLSGDIMYAEIRNGIAGSKVAAVDFRDRDQRVSDTALNDTFRDWTVASPAVWFLPPASGVAHTREVQRVAATI